MTRNGPAHRTDEDLIAQASGGDLAAFNQLVDRYERVVFAVCYRLLRNAQQAEDVAQETFIRAYSSLDQFRGGQFQAWLLRIATNRSYDVLRYERRRPATSLDEQPVEEEPRWSPGAETDDPLRYAARSELSERLETALSRLPDDQRLTVILHDVHGYPYDEIAQITNVSLGTVKSRLSRGRARLRDTLRGDAGSRELFEVVSRQLDSDESA